MRPSAHSGCLRGWVHGRLRPVYVLCLVALAACQSGKAPKGRVRAEPAAVTAHTPTLVAGSSAGGTVAPFVKGELEKAALGDDKVVVYVGATWCEPCQHFHQALQRGDLDQTLSGVRFVEFDLDKERDALERDGYKAPLIPLFAVPLADGRASDRMINGSIKGPEAVSQNLVPRLKQLLAKQP